MDTLIGNPTFVEQVTNLSSLNQIIETIIVDNNIGSIRINKTVKDSDMIRNINEEINYNLKSTRLIIKYDEQLMNSIVISDIDQQTIINDKSLCECVARNTNNILSKELSKLKKVNLHKLNYFNQNFFKKVFSPTSQDKLFKQISDCSKGYSWMIIPSSLKDLFTNNKNFIKSDMGVKPIIHFIGCLDEVNVFLNPNQKESKIYFGNYESLTLIVNKNLSINEVKTNSTTYTKGISMEVNYLLIENSPLTVLEIE